MEKHILALDLGKGSLGMAVSRSGLFATPLENFRFKAGEYQEALTQVKKVVEREMVEHFVLGLPLFPSGDECEMTPICRRFGEKLQTLFPNIPLAYQDERNSTVEASEMMHLSGENAKKQKKHIDSGAAMI
ncbi:MAG: Holliday junction resolvase RuvX, partial [Bacilli bacterium]|nr:Holliday junction resolvase RuvX [Bacilli bacterium]